MRLIHLAIASLLLPFPGRLAAQIADQKAGDVEVVRSERQIGPFAVGAEEFTVVLELASPASAGGSADTTVAGLRLVDSRGVVHFREEFQVEFNDDGDLWFVREVYPSVVEYSGGRLLALTEIFFPSAPQSGVTWRLFAWRDGSLRPVSGPIAGYGEFVQLPEGESGGAERLLPGDLFYFDAWAYYFAVRVPIAIRPEASEVGERVRFEAEEVDGLVVLPISGAERYEGYESGPAAITLYDSATGTAGREVIVTSATTLEFGPAYVELTLGSDMEERVSIGVKVVRVQVRIDGRDGFVLESDLQRLGLRSAG